MDGWTCENFDNVEEYTNTSSSLNKFDTRVKIIVSYVVDYTLVPT